MSQREEDEIRAQEDAIALVIFAFFIILIVSRAFGLSWNESLMYSIGIPIGCVLLSLAIELIEIILGVVCCILLVFFSLIFEIVERIYHKWNR